MEKYKLVKQIGQGSYGDVWLVRKNSKSSKLYVLKQINLEHASKREQRAAHLEVKLLSTLKHPNIVSYLDSFYNSKGSLYIVMGYCENGDLYTHIRKQRGTLFEEKQIVEWFIQICMALKCLHEKKILHRDLKTQNIFLTRSKLIKVGDLGIARVLDGTRDMATTLIGTPYYMSPELYCNKPYNHKSDVWALGCCVYEMATLRHAFNARDLNSLMQKILNGKLSGMPKMYSPDFVQIIYSMLNHDPQQRPNVTDILMNVYVQKHIELFLEETNHSCKQSYGKVKKQNTNNIFINNNKAIIYNLTDAKRDASGPARQNCIKNLMYMPNNSKRSSTCSVKKVTVTVPDINGNGDGNDNSRQRFIIAEKNNEISESKAEVRKSSFNAIKHHKILNKPVSKIILTEMRETHHEANVNEYKDDNHLSKVHFSNNIISNAKAINMSNEGENPVVTCAVSPKLVETVEDTEKISLEPLKDLTYTIEKQNFLSRNSKVENFQCNAVLRKINSFSLIFIPNDISQLSPLPSVDYVCIKSESVNSSSNGLPKSKARLRRRYNVNLKKNDAKFPFSGTKLFKVQGNCLQCKEKINYQSEIFFDKVKNRNVNQNMISADSEKECRISYSSNESENNVKNSTAVLLNSSLPVINQNPVNTKDTKCPDESKVDSSLLKEIMNSNVGSLAFLIGGDVIHDSPVVLAVSRVVGALLCHLCIDPLKGEIAGHPNSAARQRRRQQLDNKFNKLSAETSMSTK